MEIAKLVELIKGIHQNAVAHGWWDEPRDTDEIYALIRTELSEAIEEERAGRPMVYCKCIENGEPCEGINCDYFETFDGGCKNSCLDPKPEGIAVEMADAAIRIMDYIGEIHGNELDSEDVMFLDGYLKVCRESIGADMKGESLCSVTEAANGMLTRMRNNGSELTEQLVYIVALLSWGDANGIDLESIIRLKHEYNKTRPYKHGKKY